MIDARGKPRREVKKTILVKKRKNNSKKKILPTSQKGNGLRGRTGRWKKGKKRSEIGNQLENRKNKGCGEEEG